MNRAIEELVVARLGQPFWERLIEEARLDSGCRACLATFPDCLSEKLVNAAATLLELPPDLVLETFGELWAEQAAQRGVGEVVRCRGRNLREFLENLDATSGRAELNFPLPHWPHLRCEDGPEGDLLLHYQSERRGFAPLMMGLVRGLGQIFGEPVSIVQVGFRDRGDPSDVFRIRNRP